MAITNPPQPVQTSGAPAMSSETAFFRAANLQSASRSRLLVVDDDVMNSDLLRERLETEGYQVATAAHGREALDKLRAEKFDLVLLDIVMPELDGYQVLKSLKADEQWREIPVIMISGLDDLNSVAKCIQHGADDYLPKPYKPILLQARINSCLEKKRLREQEQATYRALVESQQHLAAELAEAADYVKSLLPQPLTGTVTTEWRFIPSTQLGGDSFGYHWLDDDHLAMYLLDVCGHGVGAALLSISAMNVLRSCALPDTNFRDPGKVLMGLNETFQMDRHNNMYFTIWYGVFNKSTRQITHARGGHPPAILLTGGARESARAVELKAPGMVIGSMPGVPYRSCTDQVGAYGEMFLFSDGVYEITRADGTMWEYQDFVAKLVEAPPPGLSEIDVIARTAQAMQGAKSFEDDFSMVKFSFL